MGRNSVGFGIGRGYVGQICPMQQLREERCEKQKPLYLCCVDREDSYNKADRNGVCVIKIYDMLTENKRGKDSRVCHVTMTS